MGEKMFFQFEILNFDGSLILNLIFQNWTLNRNKTNIFI